jgi:hypothetical protein
MNGTTERYIRDNLQGLLGVTLYFRLGARNTSPNQSESLGEKIIPTCIYPRIEARGHRFPLQSEGSVVHVTNLSYFGNIVGNANARMMA